MIYDLYDPLRHFAAIDRFLIDITLGVPYAQRKRQTYTGIYNISSFDLSFSVRCSENFYGPDCNTFCIQVPNLYSCDDFGIKICNDQLCHPTTNCRVCSLLTSVQSSSTTSLYSSLQQLSTTSLFTPLRSLSTTAPTTPLQSLPTTSLQQLATSIYTSFQQLSTTSLFTSLRSLPTTAPTTSLQSQSTTSLSIGNNFLRGTSICDYIMV